ncbi:MAG: HAD-IIIC family phosphatase [Lachnospiraceae bacterium]|nr:HAD-IIIC family phosphatase [Lachnospiraceae bacterium]
MRELEYPFDADYLIRKKIKIRKQLLAEGGPFLEKRIAILGGSTTAEIRNMLELFLLNFGIKPKIYESEYNKFYEDGLFGNPELDDLKPDVIYIHTTSRNILNWPKASDNEKTVGALVKETYDRFEVLWEALEKKFGCYIIQNNFEYPAYRLLGNADTVLPGGGVYFVNEVNRFFSKYARSHEKMFIHDINYESACYGLEKWSDSLYWCMYKYAMTLDAIPYSAFEVAKIIKAMFGKNKKVLSLDLDNTLWGGVIGDDGVNNIEIGEETPMAQGYAEFQQYLKRQQEIGVVLSVNSKNNEETAMEGFKRPDTVLKIEDFASFKANWDNKDINLVNAASELSLLPESFVFVDDNPAERELVLANVKGVSVPEMEGVENYIRTIDRSGFFEVISLSSDDAKRAEMYRENVKRAKAAASFSDYGEYLKSLEMKAEIDSFAPEYLARIAQLTNKSNQFNLTTLRLSQSEIEQMAADDKYITLYGKLADKFGDNGVVSVVIGKKAGNEVNIILWLMSCRVLKRGMEYAMMNEFVKRCSKVGAVKIRGFYYPTAKNGMVRDFYGLLGFNKETEDNEGNAIWEKSTLNYKEHETYIGIKERDAK